MVGYQLFSFDKNMSKNIGKIISKILNGKMVNIVKNFLIMLNDLQQVCLKLLQKESFKKQLKQLMISLVINLLSNK